MEEILVKDTDKKTGVHVIIDYFTVTFPFITHTEDYELLVIEDIVGLITNFLGYSKEDVYKEEYAQNRYKHQYTIGNGITLRLIGSEMKNGYKSCMLELKGEGCRDWEFKNPNKSWEEFFEFFLVRLNGNITRVDLTIDDYDGSLINFDWLIGHLQRGEFMSSFNDKKYVIYGNDTDGWSINFGNKGSEQQLVIYEKNKEQIKKKKRCIQDFWLRYEMRFRQAKAYDLVMNILNLKEKSLKEFAMERLYDMLDFKDESNITYHKTNYHRNPTDPIWLEFLKNVKKAKMTRYKIHESTFETYTEFMDPKVSAYVISRLLINSNDIYKTFTDVINVVLDNFDKMDNKKIKRVNKYLRELKAKEVSRDEIDELRYKLEKEYKQRRELPF